MSRTGRRDPLEKSIQADIEADLGAEPDLLLLRNSVGEAEYLNEATGKTWHVPYGLGKGSPDLVALLRVTLARRTIRGEELVYISGPPVTVAIWLCLEVKRPGLDATDEQKKCHAIWRRFGAFVEVVHSVQEARAALERARKLTS